MKKAFLSIAIALLAGLSLSAAEPDKKEDPKPKKVIIIINPKGPIISPAGK